MLTGVEPREEKKKEISIVKKHILFLWILTIALLLAACESGTTSPKETLGAEPAPGEAGTIRFTLNGLEHRIDLYEGKTSYLYLVEDSDPYNAADLQTMGVTSVDSLTIRTTSRILGKCTLEDGVYTLAAEKVQMSMDLICDNPKKAASQLLDFMKDSDARNDSDYYKTNYIPHLSHLGEFSDVEDAPDLNSMKITFTRQGDYLEHLSCTYTYTYPEWTSSTEDSYSCFGNGVVQFVKRYDDGELIRLEEYGESGAPIQSVSYDGNGQISSLTEYDTNGCWKTMDYYYFGQYSDQPLRITEYLGNSGEIGAEYRETLFNENSQPVCIQEYNRNGSAIGNVFGIKDTVKLTEYEYHDSGALSLYTESIGDEKTLEISYYESGAEQSRFEMDPSTRTERWTEYYESGAISRYFESHADGITRDETYYENGQLESVIKVETDGNGESKAKHYYYYENGQARQVSEYDANGLVLKDTFYYESGQFKDMCGYEYDANGQMLKETFYYESGQIEQVNEYDANGLISITYIYWKSGKVQQEMTYNPDGSRKQCLFYDENGNTYTIVENSVMIGDVSYHDASTLSRAAGYDNNGLIYREISYDENGDVSRYAVSEYSEDRQWVYMTAYWGNGVIKEYMECRNNIVMLQILYDENGVEIERYIG